MGSEWNELPGEDRAYFLDAGEGDRMHFFGVHVTQMARAVDTGGAFGLAMFQGPSGLGPPLHSHNDDSEAFVVLEGRVRWWIDDEENVSVPGDFGYIPAGSPHTFVFEGAYNKMLGYNFPGGFEGFFRDLGERTESYVALPGSGGNPEMAELAEVAKRYGWVRRDDRPDPRQVGFPDPD